MWLLRAGRVLHMAFLCAPMEASREATSGAYRQGNNGWPMGQGASLATSADRLA